MALDVADVPDLLILPRPQIRLYGDINQFLFETFMRQAEAAGDADPIVVELTTCGGEAETGRRIAQEVREFRLRAGRRVLFLGKTVVYSAGVTVMAAFPREDRFLTRDAVLLVHGRRMDLTVNLTGPLRASAQVAREVLAQIEFGLQLERAGFAELVEGSDVGLDEVCDLAASNWYVTAEEALRRGLVAGLA